MKLLFVSQAARIIYDDEGNAYLNHHMNRNVIDRYSSLVDSFSMFLRDSSIRLSKSEAEKEYNLFPHDLAKLTVGFNIYKPLKNYLNIRARITLDRALKSAIEEADKVIFSALGGYYYNRGIKMCKKMNKPYMLLCGGFALEMAQSNTNPLGKIMAYPEEWNANNELIYYYDGGDYYAEGTTKKTGYSSLSLDSEYRHYAVGDAYSWSAAIADQKPSSSTSEADESLCPAGWRLPAGAQLNYSEYGYAYGDIDYSMTKIFFQDTLKPAAQWNMPSYEPNLSAMSFYSPGLGRMVQNGIVNENNELDFDITVIS